MVAVGKIGGAIEGEERIPKEARRILHSLASEWTDVADSRALEVVQLKGALTNEVFQINWRAEGKRDRKVLVRIYGEGVDAFFDRQDEIRTFEFMSRHGQGPRLLGRFTNGRVEEFIHARTLSAANMRDPEVAALIASKLREFHELDMPGPRKANLWDRLRNWLKTAQDLLSSSPAASQELNLDGFDVEIDSLEKSLSGGAHKVGFCHNDLQYGNIMMDEDTTQITIIDYEYSCFNPVAYDIANHFCEMAADYHSDAPHNLDYTKYPGEEATEEEIDSLVESVEQYTLVSHLTWGLWGIISEHVNEIDFDYMEYARQRFEQYWLKKAAAGILGFH